MSLFDISEHYARITERDEFAIERVLPPEAVAKTEPTEDETRQLSSAQVDSDRRRNSLTVATRLASSCAGWERPPTAGEFYDAIRAATPSQREREIVGVFAQEATWTELIEGWAERAYTMQELAAALHRCGHHECHAARTINAWTTSTEKEADE